MTTEAVVALTYGPSGVGKSTDFGYSFPTALFVAAPGAMKCVQSVCGYEPKTVSLQTIPEVTELLGALAGKFETVVIDDFSFLAEQTFSLLEKKNSGFKLWGAMRDAALEFRDKARYANVNVILNCFSRRTEFVTSEGVKSFSAFSSGDCVDVLTHSGAWKKATVKSYGQRSMRRIRMERGKASYEVVATPDHRWLLASGRETTSLVVGDKLLPAPQVFGDFDFESSSQEEKLSWIKGFLCGDGHTAEVGERAYSSVRLCGHKASFLGRFVDLGFTYTFPPSLRGEPLVNLGSTLRKGLIPENSDRKHTHAFVCGLLDADGHRNKNRNSRSFNPFTGIQTSDESVANYIRKMFPAAGAYIVSEVEVDPNAKGKYPNAADANWFVLTEGQSAKPGYGRDFKVVSIEEAPAEEAWCLEVEDDHSFVLPFGVTTGNCWEQAPKTNGQGQKIRGGPQLSGKLPEQIPALCDIVLRGVHEPKRKPWGAVYRCSLDPQWVMKDRLNIATIVDPAPMNLAEILRASGHEIARHPDFPDMEKWVTTISQELSGDQMADTVKANEFYMKLTSQGVPATAARWTLRDALDRATIRMALNCASLTFFAAN